MPYANVNGVNLYYELHGPEEAEVLVLSNGVLMSTASWAFQTTVLSKYFRVLVYDCRGMWKSDHPQAPYSMEKHAEDLAALLDYLKIDQAHIAGISYGSEVSMVFAINYPERTKSLIVSNGVSQIDPLLKAFGDTWVSSAEEKSARLLLQTTAPLNFSESYLTKNKETIASLEAKYEKLDFESFIRLMDSFYRLNITDKLSLIQAPALVIVSELDNLKTRNYSERIYQHIPNAEFVIIPGAGHASCLEKPKEFNSIVLGFVMKHTGESNG